MTSLWSTRFSLVSWDLKIALLLVEFGQARLFGKKSHQTTASPALLAQRSMSAVLVPDSSVPRGVSQGPGHRPLCPVHVSGLSPNSANTEALF